jgi:hypothetical protein
MNSRLATAVALLTSLLAAAEVPAWCKPIASDRLRAGSNDVSAATETDEWDRAMSKLVVSLCAESPDALSAKKELQAAFERWSARLQMNESDWADAAEAVRCERARDCAPRPPAKGGLQSLEPMQQFFSFSDRSDVDPNYQADALGARLSEAGRLGFLRFCVDAAKNVQWAVCTADFAAFDLAKLNDELRADTRQPRWARHEVRRWAHLVMVEKLKAHQQRIAALKDEDPGYAKMFTLAEAATTEWRAQASKRQALIDLAGAMDDARVTQSRKAVEGCEEKAWPAFKAAVSAIPAKNFDIDRSPESMIHVREKAMTPVVADPEGYLASVALQQCLMLTAPTDKPDALSHMLGSVLQRWPGYRGPRNAALTAIIAANLQLDKRDTALDVPDVYRTFFDSSLYGTNGGGGIITSIKPSGPVATIAFATESRKCLNCVKTNTNPRIIGIGSDGMFIRESSCAQYVDSQCAFTPTPTTVRSRYLPAIKVGSEVHILNDTLVIGWAKGGKLPNLIAGAPVK